MRKVVIALGILAAVAVIGAFAAWAFFDVNQYRDRIQSGLEQQLGRKVMLGKMSLGLIPFRFEVENPTVAEDPAFSASSPFVRADKLDVAVELLPLLRGNLQIDSLDLQRPSIELLENKNGSWNVSSLGASKTSSPASRAPESSERSFAVDNLQIHGGKITINGTVYDPVDVTLRMKQQASIVTAAGAVSLASPRINGKSVGYPIKADYDLSDDLGKGLVQINSAKILLGTTPLAITGSIKTNTTPPQLDLATEIGDVSISEIARLAATFGVAFNPSADIAGHLSGKVRARGTTAKPALDGAIAARDIRVSGKEIPLPVEVPAVNLTLTPAELRSNEFSAKSGKTTATGRFAVRQYTTETPSVDIALKAPNATLPEIQSFAKAWGMTGLDPLSGSGAMNLDLHAAGPLQSLSSPAVIKALNGDLNLNFDTLRIAGFDVAQELATIAGFVKPGQNNKVTDILKLAGHIVVKNGIAETNDLQAQTEIGSLTASGTADLDQSTLDLHVATIVPKAISDKVGATKAGGYMKTALANPQGELVIPALVTGTFRNPKFAPDAKAFLQMQKANLVPGLVNSILNKNPDSGQPQGIKGILGGLFGGKKDPEKK